MSESAGLIARAAATEPDDQDAAEGEAAAGAMLPAMECQPFEHHDYLMLMFRNDQDYQQACELLEIKKVQITYPGGLQKIGVGRVIDGTKAIAKLTDRASRRESVVSEPADHNEHNHKHGEGK